MMKARGIERQPSRGSTKRDRVRRGGANALQHNNGMHPTGNSMDVIRQLECLCQSFPAGDAGRYVSASC